MKDQEIYLIPPAAYILLGTWLLWGPVVTGWVAFVFGVSLTISRAVRSA